MKEQEKTSIVKAVVELIVTFVKPYGISDELLDIPTNVKRMGYKIGIMGLVRTLISLIFAYMLKITNVMIEKRLIMLGIMFFMLYRGEAVIKEAYQLVRMSDQKKYYHILDNEILFRSGQLLGKTANRVMKFDEENRVYKLMTNEAMLNCLKGYLENLWRNRIQHIFDVFEIISVGFMLVVAVLTNDTISQRLFIPLIVVFMIISFFSSAYISLSREVYYKKQREYYNQESVIINDMLRVPMVVIYDLQMRMNKFKKTMEESNNNVIQFYKKSNFSHLFVTVMEVFSQYGIIVFYLFGVEWNSISLASIAEITATLLIVETALGHVGNIARTLNARNEQVTVIKREENDVALILEVYHKESERIVHARRVEEISIAPFTINYVKNSENDIPFTLTSLRKILIKSGEIVILYGPSGSGKSTFLKMLTERIKLEKTTEIPSTTRFLFYDEKLRFGSLSLYEELFCSEENPNLAEMQEILANLHLWGEIETNCIDVWKWMKEHTFDYSLSNGQRQRLILAKMMYWLDDSIDVLVLDECTSGLDDKTETDSADAEKILEYIIRFANQGKKRMVIISTHQNIDELLDKLSTEYGIRKLLFTKDEDGERNIIKEI